MNKISRRLVLRGAGSVALGLPLLESLGRSKAARAAAEPAVPPFVIFMRQADGVASAQDTQEVGQEPERFWPRNYGALDAANVEGRALDELGDYLSQLLVVHNVNMQDFPYADGHARGALQGLTARGPVVAGAAGDSEADGESIDHRIGTALNEDGRESLFLYAGLPWGWLGGACISYRGSGNRKNPQADPMAAYASIMGLSGEEAAAEIVERQRSVNDLVRGQMAALLNHPALSAHDRERLELHRAAIRDLEFSLSCRFSAEQEALLDEEGRNYSSDNGDDILAATRAHLSVAALAVACGYTRSVAVQVGDGNDGSTRYRNPDSGQLMENFHYLSHRRQSHDSEGSIIPNSDVLHHYVDRQFAQTFRHLLEELNRFVTPDGNRLLDAGLAVWYNDLGNGPAHSPANIPFIIGGSAGGFLKQGQYIRAEAGEWEPNHNKMLNTLGSAVGLRNGAGEYLDDFGDPELPKGILSELLV